MDFKIAVNIIGALASVFAIYKLIVDVILAKSTQRRDEYEFTKKFLDDLNDESTHPFIVEKGFFALSGYELRVSEIRYLLNTVSPSLNIRQRRISEQFIEFDSSINLGGFDS